MNLTYEHARNVVNFAADVVNHGTVADFKHFRKAINDAKNIRKYFKLALFQPYEYQRTWFASGSVCLLRYLSAANRIGKTYGAAAEFVYHATGQYPDGWDGYRVTNQPIGTDRTLWAVGISSDATRTVLQKELMGTADAKESSKLGTGMIPAHLITSIERDGHRVKSCRVKHVSGEESYVYFYSASQEETVFMGQSIVYAWIDEQSPNEQKLIAQCTTRTTTTSGCVAVTATPEQGASDFYIQCRDDTSGEIHFQKATWADAPHITPDMRRSMLARIPYFQRKMRSEGEPVSGVGAIYPFSDEQLFCDPFEIPAHWLVLRAADFGYSGVADPSTLVDVAYDPATGNRYIFGEWVSNGCVGNSAIDGKPIHEHEIYANSHMPDYMACKIIGAQPNDWTEATNGEHEFTALPLPSIVVKLPHDGNGLVPGTQHTRGETMRSRGANVHPDIWEIPPDLAPLAQQHVRSLIGSIGALCTMMQDGKFKIFKTLTRLRREVRGYQWVQKGERSIPGDKDNHCLDAMRIGACRVHVDGIPMCEAVQPAATALYADVENSYETEMEAYDL